MKTKRIVSILILSVFVLALTATACFAQAAAPDVKKEAPQNDEHRRQDRLHEGPRAATMSGA